MKPWSFLEILQVYVDLDPGGSQNSLSSVAPQRGPGALTGDVSLGTYKTGLVHAQSVYASNPAAYEALAAHEIVELTPDRLRHIHDLNSDGALYYIFTVEPLPVCRDIVKRTIASRRVFELLQEVPPTPGFRHEIPL